MIGIDLVKISRIEQMIERFGSRGLQKFLSEEEIALIRKPATAAGFWAAKEACSKALGTGIGKVCGFHDIQLSKHPGGAPAITLSAELLESFSIQDLSVSITHDGDYAIAVVAIEQQR